MKGSPEAGRNEVPPSGGTAELSDRPLRSIESSQTPFHLNGKKYTPGDIVWATLSDGSKFSGKLQVLVITDRDSRWNETITTTYRLLEAQCIGTDDGPVGSVTVSLDRLFRFD